MDENQPCPEGYMTDEEMELAQRFFVSGYNAGLKDSKPSLCTQVLFLLNERCTNAFHHLCHQSMDMHREGMPFLMRSERGRIIKAGMSFCSNKQRQLHLAV